MLQASKRATSAYIGKSKAELTFESGAVVVQLGDVSFCTAPCFFCLLFPKREHVGSYVLL